MKKLKILLSLLMFVSSVSFAQIDSSSIKKIDSTARQVLILKGTIDSLIKRSAAVSNSCYNCDKQLSWKQELLILSPVILFFIVAGYAALRLKKEQFKLADALDEINPKVKTIANPEYNATTALSGTVPATIDVTDSPNRSSSRVLAFLSGISAVVIAISSVSYFFYMYFRTGQEPNLTHIYDILLALGIGVTPYAFNKLSDAVKK